MSSWITDPELFLYTKENDVYLWRCKKTSWVPMIPEDFDDLGKVTDHLDLVGDIFEWERDDCNALVAYISPRRLLVNGQGLVIAELYKVGQDGNIDQSQPCCYIRSPDVIYMNTYIPNLRERPNPLRTVQYLEDGGRAARVLVGGSSSGSSTHPKEIVINLRDDASKEKSTAKEALEKEVSDLKAANKTLEGRITKLTVDLAARSSEVDASKEKVDDLEAMNKVLESIIATLIADQVACTNEVATLQQVLEQAKNESMRKIAALEAKSEALEDNITEVTTKLAARVNALDTSQQELKRMESNNNLAPMRQVVDLQDEIDTPVWMNGLTNRDWVGINDLEGTYVVVKSDTLTELPRGGTFLFGYDTTNVRESYFHNYKIDKVEGRIVVCVAIEELSPNVEKARFDPVFWRLFLLGGVVQICCGISLLSDTKETEG